MQKSNRVFMLIMTWFLFLNPFLDIVSGLYITIYQMSGEKFSLLETPMTPSLVIRLLMLIFMLIYLVVKQDKQSWLTLIPIGICCAVTVALEFLFADFFSLFHEAQYLAKFAFNLVMLLAYMAYFRDYGDRDSVIRFLDRIANYTLLTLTGVLLICYILNFGYHTYGDRFGYFGFRGIYYSGNDITGVFMILLPLSIKQAIESDSFKKRGFLKAFIPAMTINSLLIIGTKTAFIACGISILGIIAWSVSRYIRHKDKTTVKNMLILLLTVAALFGLLLLYSGSGLMLDIQSSFGHMSLSMNLDESGGDITNLVLSGRQHKLKAAFESWKFSGIKAWLFGIGRGTQELIIEMDVFEVFFYYGILGAIAMLWLYVKLSFSFIMKFIKKIDLCGLCLFLSMGMTTAYLIVAGHVLFSTTSGGYYALMLVYARAYCARKSEDIRI